MLKNAILVFALALALAALAPQAGQLAVTQLQNKDYYTLYTSAYSYSHQSYSYSYHSYYDYTYYDYSYWYYYDGTTYTDYNSYVSAYYSDYDAYVSDYYSRYDLYIDGKYSYSAFSDYSYLGLYSESDYTYESEYWNAWDSFLGEAGVSSELEALNTITDPVLYAGAASTFLSKHSVEIALFNSRFSSIDNTLLDGLNFSAAETASVGPSLTADAGEASNTSEPDETSNTEETSETSTQASEETETSETSSTTTTHSSALPSSIGGGGGTSSNTNVASSINQADGGEALASNAAESNKPAMLLSAFIGVLSLLLL